jgi:hypothetical protein
MLGQVSRLMGFNDGFKCFENEGVEDSLVINWIEIEMVAWV